MRKRKYILLFCLFIAIFLIISVIYYHINVKNSNDTAKNIVENSSKNSINNDNSMIKLDDNIVMTIKEGTLTKTEATVIITDNSETPEQAYSPYFRVEREENGNWKEVTIISHKSHARDTEIYYSPPEGSRTIELNCEWSSLYGELEPGHYRILKFTEKRDDTTKNVKRRYFAVEFTID